MKEFFDIWKRIQCWMGKIKILHVFCLLTLMNLIILWRPWKPTFFVAPMVGNGLFLMMPFKMHLCPLWETQGFMFNVNKLMSFHCFPFKLFVNKLTSCYLLMAPTPWMMLSLLISFESIWFHVLLYFTRSLQQWQLKQGWTLPWSTLDECIYSPLS